MTTKYKTYTPKAFGGTAPFVVCPNCNNPTFGVLNVFSDRYNRRCNTCWFDDHQPLPPLDKKVIYLDQPAISEMMNAVNTDSRKHGKNPHHDFYMAVFEKLDHLSRIQLLVCPESSFQEEESAVAEYAPALKKMYEYFSWGIN